MTDDSVAVCRAVRGIARNRLLSPLAVLTPQEVAQINHALSMSLGLA
jgi:mRNA-degrading endonuclease toxin of MazEF toxin-antitoxin module